MYTKEQRRIYISQYRAKRRLWATKLLGGKCKRCGTKTDLQFDHIDKNSKIDGIANLLTSPRKIFETEVRKCQLLCEKCHKVKTKEEGYGEPWNKGKWEHGTLTGYISKLCKCEECKKAYSEYRKKKRRMVIMV